MAKSDVAAAYDGLRDNIMAMYYELFRSEEVEEATRQELQSAGIQ
jgi:outer membrane protein TolC